MLAAPTNEQFWIRHPLSTWNKSAPVFTGIILVFLRSSPSTDTFCGNEIGFCSGYIPPATLITSPFTAMPAAAFTLLNAVLGLLPSSVSSPSSETYITFNVLAPAPTHVRSPSTSAPKTDPIPATFPLESRNVPPI